jgi:hypothetical protein
MSYQYLTGTPARLFGARLALLVARLNYICSSSLSQSQQCSLGE